MIEYKDIDETIKKKSEDSDETEIWMEINGKSVKGMIRKTTIGCMDNEFIGYIPGVEIVMDGVCIVQKFHVKCELASDVILGMPWFMKTRCGFIWMDRKYYYTT
ncbi:hypothetical protein F8M41_026283 [Gigaspora margarita]|uniref:Uncharacterized protein n=1 Tax=Gigaspora margarita TaxID=4874 RepID=A0A8H3XHW7_GIGMA|nr:hypothetical protein F8M41_026283 [Gigaspora margarita]